MRPIETDVAHGQDRNAIAAMLARAFADDPAMVWIIPDAAERARRLPRLFRLLFDADGRHGIRLITSGGEAASLWREPGVADSRRGETMLRLWSIWRALGGGMSRGLAASAAIEAHFPSTPFWYLHIAGCDPIHQGQGFGRAAVQAGLDRIGNRRPVYLETAKEANLGFYTGLGFRVTEQWSVPDGPRFWSLLRS